MPVVATIRACPVKKILVLEMKKLKFRSAHNQLILVFDFFKFTFDVVYGEHPNQSNKSKNRSF
jgi:hypothetical protein